jgi:hypothetical protein
MREKKRKKKRKKESERKKEKGKGNSRLHDILMHIAPCTKIFPKL